MRKIGIIFGLCFLAVLVACQSAESKEVKEYHNNYIENVEVELENTQTLAQQFLAVESEDEVRKILKEDLEPIVKKVEKYMDSQNPKENDTKDYHELRKASTDAFVESMELDIEAYMGLIEGDLTEEQAEELLIKSEEKYDEFNDMYHKANDKIEELIDKYNFKELED